MALRRAGTTRIKTTVVSRSRKTAAEPKTGKRILKAAPRTAPPDENLIPGQIRPKMSLGHGPAKDRPTGAPPPRLSNHKIRSRWFRARAAFPLREAPVGALISERDRVARSLPLASPGASWESIGPTNIGGRMTTLVCHPTLPDRIWAGAAGGGVWFSPDGGQSWTSQWHDQEVLNVGSLAVDPLSPNVLYCGTGEANLSADSYGGVGIYRSLDAGVSWHLFAARGMTGLPARIGVIAVDPFDRTHLLVGGVGYAEMGGGDDDLGGLYASNDAGVTWRRETFLSSRNYWCHSIVFDPLTRGRVYATFTAQGMKSGIYRSVDGGKTWGQLTKGLPPAARFGRTTLAIAPSQPNTIYALAADQQSQHSDLVLGVFRSRDGGDRWTNVARAHFVEERQMNYGSTIVVHPQKPNHVLCGGVDLHLSTNGGTSWQQVTRWNRNRGDSDFAHADHHCLVMPAAHPGRVYDTNDGGLDVSDDAGKTWKNRSTGLAVTMFYDADVAQTTSRVFGGGAQDNGTVVTVDGPPGTFNEIVGGDGGWIVWDPKDAGHLYASSQFFRIFRFRNGAVDEVSPPADKNEQESVWMCFITLDPNDSDTVFTGTYRVWRTRDDGKVWTPVSPALDESPITAIHVADRDSNRVYVGTENGGIFRSDDGGDTWSANIVSSEIPGFSITRLATDPKNADVVYVTIANFAASHVFRSRDGGNTWEDIDSGRLPRVPHHVITTVEQSGKLHLYVGNDVGVFASGGTWSNISGNLPHVMVVDLVHQIDDNTLTAATYGRSLWRMRL
jgi:photosystem II stability/assembly factor-like uncharacterized protein